MTILLRYFDLCLFKINPADVPASVRLLQITLLFYFVVGVALSQIDLAWEMSLFSSFADTLFMFLATSLLLKFRGFQARFVQTLTALAGTGALFGLVSLPFILWFNQVPEAEQANSYALFFLAAIMFWSLMVTAHIFRYALEIKVGTSAVLTVIYTALSLLTLGLTMSGVA